MDVFQGRALEVQTRIPAWRKTINPCIPPVRAGKRRQNGAAGRAEPRPLSALDCMILRDVGLHAKAFMAAVRELPQFKPQWENNAEVAVVGLLRIHRGALAPDEKLFDKNYARAIALLSTRRVHPDEAHGAELSLRRVLPHAVASIVVEYYGRR